MESLVGFVSVGNNVFVAVAAVENVFAVFVDFSGVCHWVYPLRARLFCVAFL